MVANVDNMKRQGLSAKPYQHVQMINSSTQYNSATQPYCFIFDVMGWRLISIFMACIISLIDPSKQKIVKTSIVDENYAGAEKRVKQLNEKLNEKPNKKELFWVVTTIGV